MARNYVPQLSEFPYHITNRCVNRERFFTSIEETWQILVHHLSYAQYQHDLRIFSFVLMPNHFHLLASTSTFPIGYIMRDFFSNTSKDMNKHTGRINQNWGSRYYRCEIDRYHYFLNCYKYVYQNPVAANLTDSILDWPYSTLNGVLGLGRLNLLLENDTVLFNPEFDQNEFEWLNQKIKTDDLFTIKSSLKKKKFTLPYLQRGKPHPLSTSRI